MKGYRFPLRLACRKCFGGHLEIGNDGIEHGISVLYDNSRVEAPVLNSGAGCANSEPLWICMLLEPCKKQAITIGFATVAIVAHIKQNVKMLCKELFKNSKDCLFYFRVVWRFAILHLFYNKLIGFASTHWRFLFKGYGIAYSKFCFESEFSIGGKPDIISSPTINLLNRELHHSETMGPVYPSLRHCSSMRFSAARLISIERFQRANASSYVGFFISIMLSYLTFHAAKLSINSDITSKFPKNNGRLQNHH